MTEKNPLQALENKLRASRAFLDALPAPLAYLTPLRSFDWVNQAYCDMLGKSREELIGSATSKFTRMEAYLQSTPFFMGALDGKSAVMESYQPNRTSSKLEGRWFELSWVPDVVANQVVGVFVIYRDIHEARIAYDSLIKAAQIDALTGLLNRRSFMRELETRLGNEGATETVVLYMDLDGFKPINDAHGHGVGDVVLQSAAARIRDALRGADIAARIGGDEFVVCFSSSSPMSASQLLCERILTTLAQPMDIGEQAFTVSASIGVAFTPTHGSNAEDLLKRADEAMYVAKRAGKAQYRIATAIAF